MNRNAQFISEALNEAGIKFKLIPVHRLEDLRSEIEVTLKQKITSTRFSEYVGYCFDFDMISRFPNAKSVLVCAKHNPTHELVFHHQHRPVQVLLPPGYVNFQKKQQELKETVTVILKKYGYQSERIFVPLKLLAAHSGLGKYGKNNICYVDDFGSHHYLGAYITDIPSETDVWIESETMPCCFDCRHCLESCPTEAIKEDRFLIHGERCLTFFNRNPGQFPDWIKPEWHNSLFGCIICQEVCPLNHHISTDVEILDEYSEEETDSILHAESFNLIPLPIQQKIEKYGFPELHPYFIRNLKAILKSEG